MIRLALSHGPREDVRAKVAHRVYGYTAAGGRRSVLHAGPFATVESSSPHRQLR